LRFFPSGQAGVAGDHGRGRDYGDLRGLIDRVQSDLRAASDLEHGNKQRDRYHNAQDNLSKFDRSLSKGKFDKGALDHSINGVKDILEHNTLQGSSRDNVAPRLVGPENCARRRLRRPRFRRRTSVDNE